MNKQEFLMLEKRRRRWLGRVEKLLFLTMASFLAILFLLPNNDALYWLSLGLLIGEILYVNYEDGKKLKMIQQFIDESIEAHE